MARKRDKVLVVVGPTASGKSALAIELAKKLNGEIISADSRQVYRGLDIGTGKVTRKEMQSVPHYLLDVASPQRNFTAHEFAQQARAAMLRIAARASLPIVVGGTGFYIDALLGRTPLPDVPPNRTLRARLHKKTVSELYELLKARDPARARSMSTPSERNNKVRLIRALEIAASQKHSSSRSPQKISKDPPHYGVLWLGIAPQQQELERRIRKRLRARIRAGMIAEGKRLHKQGLSFKRMEELGLEYRALARLLQDELPREKFEEELFRDIRRYAKKQLAYWKRNRNIKWFPSADSKRIPTTVAKWLRE